MRIVDYRYSLEPSWSRGDELTGSIRFRVDDDCLVQMYRARSYGGDWKDIEETDSPSAGEVAMDTMGVQGKKKAGNLY